LYGLDAELFAKRIEKRDPMIRRRILDWVETETGQPCRDLYEDLRSGELLCDLFNALVRESDDAPAPKDVTEPPSSTQMQSKHAATWSGPLQSADHCSVVLGSSDDEAEEHQITENPTAPADAEKQNTEKKQKQTKLSGINSEEHHHESNNDENENNNENLTQPKQRALLQRHLSQVSYRSEHTAAAGNRYAPLKVHRIAEAKMAAQAPMLERENLRNYLEACRRLGMREEELFTQSDLLRRKYLDQVELHLYALNRLAQLSIPQYRRRGGRAVGVEMHERPDADRTWSARHADLIEARRRYVESLTPVNQRAEAVLNAQGQRLFGMDADLYVKREEKRTDAEEERHAAELLGWVSSMLRDMKEVELDGGVVQRLDQLTSGRELCALANRIAPGVIPKVHTKKIKLLERENIQFYLHACKRMGLRDMDLFAASDLIDGKYPEAVYLNLAALRRLHQKYPKGVKINASREQTPLLLGNRNVSSLEEETRRCSCSCIIL